LVAATKLAEVDKAKAIAITTSVSSDQAAPVDLRIAMRSLLVTLDEKAAVQSYLAAYQAGQLEEKQDAIKQLAALQDADARSLIATLAADLSKNALPGDLRLDVYEALSTNQDLPLQTRSAAVQYQQAHLTPGEEPFIRDALLTGGSISAGKEVFYNHPGATCTQCHRMDDQPAQGPSLSGIGAFHDVSYLYTAVVNPNADIAEGYAVTTVRLKDGSIKTGRVLKEKSTPAQLVLINSEGKQDTIARQNIQGQPVTSGQSMMKKMNEQLSPRELRDLLAFLVSLKGDGTTSAGDQHNHGQANKIAGPQLRSPAKDIPHHFVLPMVLLGIFASLGVLLLVTVLGGATERA